MQYRIVGELVSDNVSANFHEDDVYVVQAVNEVGVGVGPLRTILKSRVHNNKIYWPDEKMPEEELWQELIRTRKALGIAINAMKSAGTHNSINCIVRGEDPSKDDVGITINRALNKITALEQKEQE